MVLSVFAFLAMLLVGLTSAASPFHGDRTILNIASLPVIGIVAGLLMIGYSLFQMWVVPRLQASTVTIAEQPGVYVITKFAINLSDIMEFPFEPDPSQEYKYYVRLQLANGRRAELRTSEATYFSLGEGMTGTAKIQGDWLGQFTAQQSPPRLG